MSDASTHDNVGKEHTSVHSTHEKKKLGVEDLKMTVADLPIGDGAAERPVRHIRKAPD